MNREIKFRAWDIKRKFYKYPKLWDNTMPSNWESHYILEQFTGLKDKNGVDIYEGDILKCWDDCVVEEWSKYHTGVIIYHGLSFTLKVEENHLYWFHNAENIEVIGSIHSNP